MIGSSLMYWRTALQVAVAAAVVLVPASASHREAPNPPFANASHSPGPKAVTPPVPVVGAEPIVEWPGPRFVATVSPQGAGDLLPGLSPDEVTVIPEPSVIVFLLGGMGIAIVARRRRGPF